MTPKPGNTSGRFKGTSSIVIALNLEFQLYVPKEETFPFPLKHIDVTRANYTILDVLQGQRLDDCWKIEVYQSLGQDSRSSLY